MNDAANSRLDQPDRWTQIAIGICESPFSSQICPLCGSTAVSGEWNLLDAKTRETTVDLRCMACNARQNVRIPLPGGAPPYWPYERFAMVTEALQNELKSLADRVQQHVKSMPAAAFATHPLWAVARWSATTYQWHPRSEAPPVMGLVFDDVEAGLELFREAEREMNHEDRFEEIRISIIEGVMTGQEQRPGYSVHICTDPDALCGHATFEDFVVDQRIVPFLGQWNRHFPVPGAPLLLPKFRQEFEKHNEFLLAPTMRRDDGQLYMAVELGIIKNTILFRTIADITSPSDTDAAALVLPHLITPPG